MAKKKGKKHQHKPEEKIIADPMGSYTGVPDDPKDIPVQDADDL